MTGFHLAVYFGVKEAISYLLGISPKGDIHWYEMAGVRQLDPNLSLLHMHLATSPQLKYFSG